MTAKLDQIKDQAAALLQAGRTSEAEPLLRGVLAENPHHTEGLQLMGVVQTRLNNLQAAEQYFKAAIASDEKHWPAMVNIASVYLKADNPQAAFDHAQLATRLAPEQPAPWRRLGDAAERISQFDIGCTAFARLSELGAADAKLELRGALHGVLSSRFDMASAAIKRAVAKGAPREQVFAVSSELALKRGHWAELQKIAAAWREADPTSRKARELASRAENELGNPDLAVELYRPLIDGRDDISADEAVTFGRMCLNAQRHEEAGLYLETSALLKPDNPDVLTSLSRLRTFEGEFEKAKELCIRAIDLDPDHIRAYLQLSVVTRGDVSEVHRKHMETLYEGEINDANLRSALALVLGDTAFRRQQAEEALKYYTLGNNQRAEEAEQQGFPYDREIAARDVSLLEDLAPYLADIEVEPPSDLPRPIFITGLPRSGTTLMERILGAHPEVTAYGERVQGPKVLETVLRRTLEDGAAVTARWVAEKAPMLRGYYLEGIAEDTGAFTDKMPGNALGIALFATLFPQARFILTFRCPFDVAVSIFRHRFPYAYNWSHRLEDIAHYAPLYMAAAARFARQWGERSHIVNYDELVADKAANIPLLVKAAGLEWDEACADPGMSGRRIQTFSSVQVRSEISAKSSDGGALLRPLMADYADELDRAVTEAVSSSA